MTTPHPLAAFRAANQLSVDEMASRLGVAALTIKRWEAAEVLPRGKKRDDIRRVTGLRFADFVAFFEKSEERAA